MASPRDLFDELTNGGWTTVQSWIAEERTESLHLEFKSRRGACPPAGDLTLDDKGDIAAALSAFANVEGGVFVFGLRTTPPGSRRDPDALDSDLTRQAKTYLEDAPAFTRAVEKYVRALTDPTVPALMARGIIDPANTPRGVVALYIPESDAKPHRVAHGLAGTIADRYYMRTNTSSDLMPHAMLAALFGRSPPPLLRLIARQITPSMVAAPLVRIVRLSIENVGRGTARDVMVRFARESLALAGLRINDGSAHVWKRGHVTSRGVRDFVFPGVEVLHPGVEDHLCDLIATKGHSPPQDERFAVRIAGTLFASDMQPRDVDTIVRFARLADVAFLPPDEDR